MAEKMTRRTFMKSAAAAAAAISLSGVLARWGGPRQRGAAQVPAAAVSWQTTRSRSDPSP